MILRNIAEAPALRVRSCCRCGSEFRAFGERVRVCGSCRRPLQQSRTRAVPGQELTHRERQVAELVARGLSNKHIAFELHLTEGTIKAYLCQIFQKTSVSNRTELAVWHVRGGSPS